MRIGILAPLKRELSKETTGGRPRIVYNLVEELCRRGHDVTVFGTGDSHISAHLISVIPQALYHTPAVENEFYRHTTVLSEMMRVVLSHQGEFDVIHNHLYPEAFPYVIASQLSCPMITTVHLQIDATSGAFFSQYPHIPIVPISDCQRKLYPHLPYRDIVYNGIDETIFSFASHADDYLLFIGRIREPYVDEKGNSIDPKGVTDAIRVAKKSGSKLIIAGNVESYAFFEREIAPHLSDHIQFVGDPHSKEGSLTLQERVSLYQHAKAFLFPIHIDEPFGITMIEAMSCGTPVIAYDRGAVSEVVVDGIHGFVVSDEDAMVKAVSRISTIDRHACRERVLELFTAKKMADGYEMIYQSLTT